MSFAHVDPFTFASLDQPRLIETAAGTIHNASETRVGSIVDMSGEADFTVCDDTFCRSETGAPVSFHGLLVPTGVQASPTLATVYITGAVLYGTFTINN